MSSDMSFPFYQNLPRTPSLYRINYIYTYLKNIFHSTVPTYQRTNKKIIFQHKNGLLYYILII
nr:MAG TPA_asm: hypothetical protein [Caudoviricetes sp.]